MKYSCLVMDHDDTVVNSTATVHFPCFCEFLSIHFPDRHYDLDEYLRKNFDPGVLPFFQDEIGMNEDMLQEEYRFWNAYVQNHVPKAYPGMKEILWEQKRQGGLICVVSHSMTENILRDYRENGLPEPDLVFGWESPAEERKPNPYPLLTIEKKLSLKPEDMLMVDDLKPGYDMAQSVGVPFAAALWANDIPMIQNFMRKNCPLCFRRVEDLGNYLFG